MIRCESICTSIRMEEQSHECWEIVVGFISCSATIGLKLYQGRIVGKPNGYGNFFLVVMQPRMSVSRACNKLGIKGSSVSKQTRHLHFDHPSMEVLRNWVTMACQTSKVNERLVAHFDQVWTQLYEPAKRVLYKNPEEQGKNDPDRKLLPPSKTNMLDCFRKALNLPGSMVRSKEKDGPQKASLCAQSTLVPIDYARYPRTTTTLSWIDGTMGRAYVTAASNVLSAP